MKITSKANSLIKQTKKLKQKKYRTHSYLIEGWHLVEEAQKANQTFKHLFVLEEMAERLSDFKPVTVVSPEVLKELTESPKPQGVIAEVAMKTQPLPEELTGRYLVLEDIQDPGNVGTIIRTADAACFDGVFISQKTADIYNEKTLRAMQGSHFHLPIWRADISEICARVQAARLPLLASTLSSTSVAYQDLAKSSSFALVLGNEGRGISDYMTEQADQLVHIPMPGQAESLNVAVAAGILIFSLI